LVFALTLVLAGCASASGGQPVDVPVEDQNVSMIIAGFFNGLLFLIAAIAVIAGIGSFALADPQLVTSSLYVLGYGIGVIVFFITPVGARVLFRRR
jgi:hypothetical protein